MNEINDIKNLVEIPDFSFYIFVLLCILFILVFTTLVFLIYKKIKHKKKNLRKEYYKILKNIDFSNAKEDSYKISKYLRLLAKNQKEKSLSNELINDLEQYKYKKEVNNINKKDILKFEIIMEIIDV